MVVLYVRGWKFDPVRQNLQPEDKFSVAFMFDE
jgi:hypothetical protein